MNGRLISYLFPLLFLDAPGDGGGGGGIGDVADIPLGHDGDMAILNNEGDDDGGDDDGASGDDGEGADNEDGIETFGQEDDDEGGEEGSEEGDEGDGEDTQEGEEEGQEEDVKIFEGRPTLTDIKTKYPKIFKEFPELREVLFRESEFTKEFGTVEEAQEAAVKARSFNVIEASLLGGDPSPIINQLAQNAPDALAQVVDNFLPNLLQQSESLYLRAALPIAEKFLWSLQEHGKQTGNVNFVRSAQHAALFLFGKAEIPDPSRRRGPEGPHPAEKKLEEERKQWAEQRFKEASSEISSEVDSELKSEVLKGLDPQKQLNEWQREKLIEDILNDINATLSKDTAFQRQMKALWTKASGAGFPRDQRASIKSAFLARAKALVPSVRTRLRAKALGDKAPNSGKPTTPKDGKVVKKNNNQPPKKRSLPESGAAGRQQPNRPPSPRDVDYTRTSDMDLIEGRFARKR